VRKIIKIDTTKNCAWCPYRDEYFDRKTKSDKNKCRLTKRIIKDILTIPDWCPLDDYIEIKEVK